MSGQGEPPHFGEHGTSAEQPAGDESPGAPRSGRPDQPSADPTAILTDKVKAYIDYAQNHYAAEEELARELNLRRQILFTLATLFIAAIVVKMTGADLSTDLIDGRAPALFIGLIVAALDGFLVIIHRGRLRELVIGFTVLLIVWTFALAFAGPVWAPAHLLGLASGAILAGAFFATVAIAYLLTPPLARDKGQDENPRANHGVGGLLRRVWKRAADYVFDQTASGTQPRSIRTKSWVPSEQELAQIKWHFRPEEVVLYTRRSNAAIELHYRNEELARNLANARRLIRLSFSVAHLSVLAIVGALAAYPAQHSPPPNPAATCQSISPLLHSATSSSASGKTGEETPPAFHDSPEGRPAGADEISEAMDPMPPTPN